MKFRLFTILSLLLIPLIGVTTTAEDRTIKVAFVEDGKVKDAAYKIKLYVGEKEFDPIYSGGGFILPDEIDSPVLELKIIIKDRLQMNFPELRREWFKTKWLVVGIDNKPFEQENMLAVEKMGLRNFSTICYIKFTDNERQPKVRIITRPC